MLAPAEARGKPIIIIRRAFSLFKESWEYFVAGITGHKSLYVVYKCLC